MNRSTRAHDTAATAASERFRPAYGAVLLTIVRNSLMRDMSFRSNFVIECISSTAWMLMNLGFYLLVFHYTPEIGRGTGWGKYEYFVFLSTTMFVNSVVQAFFMPNAQQFSELIRTGNLDFALLKPIDTQFLISLHRVEWSALSNFMLGLVLMAYSVIKLTTRAVDPLWIPWYAWILYPFYVACGIAIFYSVMLVLASTSVWLGRNQTLYNFWFYITNFARYPMEIYQGRYGEPLRIFFTYLIPVLIVVNVPARVIVRPLSGSGIDLPFFCGFAIVATIGSLLASRWVFRMALVGYRSASS